MKKLKPAAHYIVVLQIRSQKLLITVIFVLIFLNGYLIFMSEHICVCVYLAPYMCISLSVSSGLCHPVRDYRELTDELQFCLATFL